MADNKITRREVIKDITVGVGVIATLPVLGSAAQDHAMHAAQTGWKAKPYTLKFFTADENRALISLSEQIIPADAHSPGAKAARVNEYIDTIVNVSPEQTKQAWRDGLKAIDKKSADMFGKPFADATAEQQVQLLKEISKNERNPQTPEDQFFRRIKNSTIDGYYTSEIGIHQELKYKGNSFLKEFPGCTHPEHQS
jgi:hypothetical protein